MGLRSSPHRRLASKTAELAHSINSSVRNKGLCVTTIHNYNAIMIYEWDDAKSQANLAKHGLAFEDARVVFERDVITVSDQRKDYGEPRFASLGSYAVASYLLPTRHAPAGCGLFRLGKPMNASKKSTLSDLPRIDAMSDAEIDYSDAPDTNVEFWNAAVVVPWSSGSHTLRIDPDIVDYFKTGGNGYQTRINAVLRSYVKAHQSKQDDF